MDSNKTIRMSLSKGFLIIEEMNPPSTKKNTHFVNGPQSTIFFQLDELQIIKIDFFFGQFNECSKTQ